jgi:hypothetical protein
MEGNKEMNLNRLAIVCVVSWLAGVMTYLSSLRLIYGQTVSGNDLTAVLAWSFAASLIAFPLIYLPMMFLLRRLLNGFRPIIAFPLVASLAFILPTSFIVFMFSLSIDSFLHSLFDAEARLFHFMFIVVGFSFGLGFVWCFRNREGYR